MAGSWLLCASSTQPRRTRSNMRSHRSAQDPSWPQRMGAFLRGACGSAATLTRPFVHGGVLELTTVSAGVEHEVDGPHVLRAAGSPRTRRASRSEIDHAATRSWGSAPRRLGGSATGPFVDGFGERRRRSRNCIWGEGSFSECGESCESPTERAAPPPDRSEQARTSSPTAMTRTIDEPVHSWTW